MAQFCNPILHGPKEDFQDKFLEKKSCLVSATIFSKPWEIASKNTLYNNPPREIITIFSKWKNVACNTCTRILLEKLYWFPWCRNTYYQQRMVSISPYTPRTEQNFMSLVLNNKDIRSYQSRYSIFYHQVLNRRNHPMEAFSSCMDVGLDCSRCYFPKSCSNGNISGSLLHFFLV